MLQEKPAQSNHYEKAFSQRMGFMRRFYLHKRSGIFYAELLTVAGIKLNARSTGKRTRDEALLVVADWLKDGLPVVKQRGYVGEAGSAKLKPISTE
jgi:hypothetical protein